MPDAAATPRYIPSAAARTLSRGPNDLVLYLLPPELRLDSQFGELVEHLAAALARAREEHTGKGASDHAPVVVDLANSRTATVRRHPGFLEVRVSQVVDYENVSTVGLESSPVAEALAGLRANEARYYRNKYGHVFTVDLASDATEAVDWVHHILREERDIVIAARPLEATIFEVDGLRMAYVFYDSGLAVNVMYGLAAGGKRAVGFKLSEGMEVPEELASRFKFARQKSKLAGTIRGSFFVIKGEY